MAAAEGVAKSGGLSDEEMGSGGGVESNEDEVDERKSVGVSVGSGGGVEESMRIDRNESGEATDEVGDGIAGEELVEDCEEMNVAVEGGEIDELVERMGTDEAAGEGEKEQMEADGVAEDEEGGGNVDNWSVEEQKESIELRELTPEVEERVETENAMDELIHGERGVMESEESMEGEESGRMDTDENILNANESVGMESENNGEASEDGMRGRIEQDEALEEDAAEELRNKRGVAKIELVEETGKSSLSGFVEPRTTKLLFSPAEVSVKKEEMDAVEEVKKEEHYNGEAIGIEEMVKNRDRTEMKEEPQEDEEKEEEGLPPLQSVEPSPSPPKGKVKEEVGDVKMKTEEEVIGEEEGPPPGYQVPLIEPASIPSPAKSQSPKRPLVSEQLQPAVLEAPRPPPTPNAPSYEMAQIGLRFLSTTAFIYKRSQICAMLLLPDG